MEQYKVRIMRGVRINGRVYSDVLRERVGRSQVREYLNT